MSFFELIKKRHSTRSFQKKPVDKVSLDKILTAAEFAPSAGNLNAYEITVVKDEGQKKSLSEAALGQTSVALASIVLVFSAVAGKSTCKYAKRGELYSIQDATIACSYAQLAAADLNLGSVWVGAFNEAEVSVAAKLKPGSRPIALLPIGHP